MRKKIQHTTELTNVRHIQDVKLDLIDAMHHCDGTRMSARLNDGVLEFNYSKGSLGASESDKVIVRFSKPLRVDVHDIAALLASLPVYSNIDDAWFIDKLTSYPNLLKMSIGNAGVIIDSHGSN